MLSPHHCEGPSVYYLWKQYFKLFFVFQDRVSLCSLGCPRIHYVAQVGSTLYHFSCGEPRHVCILGSGAHHLASRPISQGDFTLSVQCPGASHPAGPSVELFSAALHPHPKLALVQKGEVWRGDYGSLFWSPRSGWSRASIGSGL